MPFRILIKVKSLIEKDFRRRYPFYYAGGPIFYPKRSLHCRERTTNPKTAFGKKINDDLLTSSHNHISWINWSTRNVPPLYDQNINHHT